MTKHTHTHRGHCQLCACVQAIDLRTGVTAKHGYTVDRGYFSGECPGSGAPNLHVDRTRADASIMNARAEAARLMDVYVAYGNGTSFPSRVWSGEYQKETYRRSSTGEERTRDVEVMVSWEMATGKYQVLGLRRAMADLAQRIESCTRYADTLQTWADKITGKVDAYEAKDLEPREWTVGDVLRIGGKKGFNAVIEAIEDRAYRSFGFSRGRTETMKPHALVTIPARPERKTKDGYVLDQARPARQSWEALRNHSRAKSALVVELEKAKLL